jgi:lysophospholipase L1-like esterase
VALRIALISLVAGELFLRFFRPVEFRAPPAADFLAADDATLYQRSNTPGLTYEMKPGAAPRVIAGKWVATNAEGMRDHELRPADTPSLRRIAVLGDSYVFGLGVALDDIFTEVLGKSLDHAGGNDWEVLNFGVAGYSSQEEAALLARVLAWNPYAVIIGYCLNDPETEPLQPLHVYFSPVRWWQYSHLLRLFSLFSITMETNRLGGGDYIRALHSRDGAKWPSVERAFDRIRDEAAARGIPVLLVIFPLFESPTWAEYPYRDIHAQVAAAARSRGLEVLDLLPVYEPFAPPSLWVLPEDHHPSALGHRLAAGAIHDRIEQLGWLAGNGSR